MSEHQVDDKDDGPPGDLNLIDESDEQLPPDTAPEATREADLTETGVDEDTSKEVEVEEDDAPPGARPAGDHGGPS
jgi:hypothetical protein